MSLTNDNRVFVKHVQSRIRHIRGSQIIAVLISTANNLLTDVIDEPTPCKYDYQR